MTKCFFCGYVHHDIQLNCSQCGSFYTEILVIDEPKTLTMIQKIKQQLERVLSTGVHND